MNKNLFDLAMDLLKPTDWALFESLSSSFLASDFPDLRTMASPSGDGGRDSELFNNKGTPIVACQYSVASDWKSKILHTLHRLQTTFPSITILVYVTNQVIGAKADSLRSEILTKGIVLDVRDRSWFLERCLQDETKSAAAEDLIARVAKPYLAGEKIIESKSFSLSTQEAKAALLYLGLQWQDDISGKGLTKLSYEALVRAVLRNTDSMKRLRRQDIYERICGYLPSYSLEDIKGNIDSALARLTKRFIRHWKKEDEFCLTYEESERLKVRLAEREREDKTFENEIRRNCEICLSECKGSAPEDVIELSKRTRRVLNLFLLEKGEAFASEALGGDLRNIGYETLSGIIMNDINQYPPEKRLIHLLPEMIKTMLTAVVVEPTEETQNYLRCLSDSYTLFAFLREVPDVQGATKKLFSYGEIWLDTTVLLPIFAEGLSDLEGEKRFTKLFKTVSRAGISLKMTPGVVMEILSHMNISEACSRYKSLEWRGRIPYLYHHYLQSGNKPSGFTSWLELFHGYERPEDDISDYLLNEFNITTERLDIESDRISPEIKWAIERLWQEAHKKRRNNQSGSYDPDVAAELVKHDVENYIGVISLRASESVSEFGFKHWWLTTDTIAWQIRDEIKKEFHSKAPSSPILSLDFLVNNLAFGPNRLHVAREEEQKLPLILDSNLHEFLPQEIGEIAEKVREENRSLPENVVRRKVRDACDRAKRQYGCLTKQGMGSDDFHVY